MMRWWRPARTPLTKRLTKAWSRLKNLTRRLRQWPPSCLSGRGRNSKKNKKRNRQVTNHRHRRHELDLSLALYPPFAFNLSTDVTSYYCVCAAHIPCYDPHSHASKGCRTRMLFHTCVAFLHDASNAIMIIWYFVTFSVSLE